MNIGQSSYRNGDPLKTFSKTDVPALSAVGTTSGASLQVASTAEARRSDTVNLSTSNLGAAEARSLKIAQLRDSIDSGQYRVSAAAIASSMIDKAEAGSAPELSFLKGL